MQFKRQSEILAALAALCFMLAGCVDAAEPAADEPAASASAGADPEAVSTGRIVGSILDDEARPLSSASVTLVEVGTDVTTGADGAFEFRDVPLGRHSVAVGRLGYESVIVSASLDEPEQTVELQLTLVAIRIADPYQSTRIFNGYMSCGATLVPYCGVFDELNQQYGTPNPTNERWLFNFTFAGGVPPTETLFETWWTPVSGFTAQNLVFFGLTGFAPNVEGPPGFRVIIEGDEWAEDMRGASDFNFQFGIYPTLTDVVVYQTFEVYQTDFYDMTVPEGWSVIEP